MYITEQEEGLYNLYFHSCPNYNRDLFPLNFIVSDSSIFFNLVVFPILNLTILSTTKQIDIEENNNGNYLSAGEMPLPALYFMMSLIFFLSGLFWMFLLKKST